MLGHWHFNLDMKNQESQRNISGSFFILFLTVQDAVQKYLVGNEIINYYVRAKCHTRAELSLKWTRSKPLF